MSVTLTPTTETVVIESGTEVIVSPTYATVIIDGGGTVVITEPSVEVVTLTETVLVETPTISVVTAHGPTGPAGTPGTNLNWLNVMHAPYNAAGDGVTDDTAAIRAALQDAGDAGPGTVVYLPEGTFRFNGYSTHEDDQPLHLRVYAGTIMRGAGSDKTILHLLPESYEARTFTGDSDPHAFRMVQIEAGAHIEGFTVDGAADEVDAAVARVSTNALNWDEDEATGLIPPDNVTGRDIKVRNVYSMPRRFEIASVDATTNVWTYIGSISLTVGDEVLVKQSDATWNPDGSGDVDVRGAYLIASLPGGNTLTLETTDGAAVDVTGAGTGTGYMIFRDDTKIEGFSIAIGGCNNADLENIETSGHLHGSGIVCSGPAYAFGTRPTIGGHRIRNFKSYDNGWQGAIAHRVKDVIFENGEVYGNEQMGIASEFSDDITFRNVRSHDNENRGVNVIGRSENIVWDGLTLWDNGADVFSGAEMGILHGYMPGGDALTGIVKNLLIRDVVVRSYGRRDLYVKTSSNTNTGSHLPDEVIVDSLDLAPMLTLYQQDHAGVTTYNNQTPRMHRLPFRFERVHRGRRLPVLPLSLWTIPANAAVAASVDGDMIGATPWTITTTATARTLSTPFPKSGTYLVRGRIKVEGGAGEVWVVRLQPASGSAPRFEIINTAASDGTVIPFEFATEVLDRTTDYTLQVRYDTGDGTGTLHVDYIDVYEVDALGEPYAGLPIVGSSAYAGINPLTNSTNQTFTISVPGAAVGDGVAAWSLSSYPTMDGVQGEAFVTAANTVTVNIRNISGGPLVFAAGTARAWVMKA